MSEMLLCVWLVNCSPSVREESSKLCPLRYPTLVHADKEAAERLSKTVDEACLLLAEYNGRLAAELEDRRQLARMLIEYTQNQKDVLSEKEKKLEVSIGGRELTASPHTPARPLVCVSLRGNDYRCEHYIWSKTGVRMRCKKSGEDKPVLVFSLVCFNACGRGKPRARYFLKKNRFTQRSFCRFTLFFKLNCISKNSVSFCHN